MVEWKKIEEIGSYFGGLTGKTKEDFVDGNAKFITYMNVFANPSLNPSVVGVVKIDKGEKQNKVQKGDILFTGSSETPEETGMSCVVTDDLEGDFYMNSFCFGLRLFTPEQYNLHFLKHLLRSESVRKSIAKTASGVTRFNISKTRFSKIQIPIPSLSEQTCIVEILDTFTAAIENLKQQIAERRKQYEYYRDELQSIASKEWPLATLEDVAVIKNGKDYKNLSSGSIPVYGTGGIMTHVDGFFSNKPSVLLPRKGSVENIFYVETPFWTVDTLYWTIIDETKIVPKFLFLSLGRYNLKEYAYGGARPSLSQSILYKLEIPLPSLEEQSRIVTILDTFEASIANLEAQLKEREKQYEYYRNKLLTFE